METLVHAKWLELGFKSMAISGKLEQSKAILEAEAPAAAPQAHSAFFTKRKRNKIKLNIYKRYSFLPPTYIEISKLKLILN